MRIYQDHTFVLKELNGRKVQKLIVWNDADNPNNTISISILAGKNQYYCFFLDAGISFVEIYNELPKKTDDGLLSKDITQEYQLKDKVIKQVFSEIHKKNSQIIFEIGRRTFILKCVNPDLFDDEMNEFKLSALNNK